MKKLFLLYLFFPVTNILYAQKETFDITNYQIPKDSNGVNWLKEITGNTTSYTIVNKNNNNWCRINIVKSTTSKGSIAKDFESEWQELIVKSYQTTDAPQLNNAKEIDGWKIKSGKAKFKYNNTEAMTMLTTMSGYNRCASIVAITNNQEYLKDIDTFLSSVELQKIDTSSNQTIVDISDNNSVLGTWGISGSDQSSYSMNNGVNGYIVKQYTFNANGTYVFYIKTFQYTFDKLLLTKENGKYQINGNTITIDPEKSVIESWSKKNGVDSWGDLVSSQNKPLEKVTYLFSKHYFSGIKAWNLILQADKTTKRDGPFTGSGPFQNSWIYSPPCSKCFIELPN
jgi:hypothetical protein